MKLLNEILKEIKPTKKEVNEINKIIKFVLKRVPNCFVGGSIAKSTFLSGKGDIDFFVKFKTEDKMKILKEELYKLFKNINTIHGSRDYYSVVYKNYKLEFVPILEIKSPDEYVNTTDISLFHVDYVKTHLANPDDVLLLKKFLLANNLYGAESWVSGFSGYVCELLIIYYGSFLNALKEISKWKNKEIFIDIENYFNSLREVNLTLDKSKITPLIIIDPVLRYRNVAASVSSQSILKLKKISKLFLKKESKDFFYKDVLFEKIRKKAIVFNTKCKDEIYLSRLRSKLEFISKKLNEYGFRVKYGLTKNFFWFLFSNKTLPEKYIHWGPSIKNKDGLKGFIEKWGKDKVKRKNGKAYVILEREWIRAEDYLIHLLNLYIDSL